MMEAHFSFLWQHIGISYESIILVYYNLGPSFVNDVLPSFQLWYEFSFPVSVATSPGNMYNVIITRTNDDDQIYKYTKTQVVKNQNHPFTCARG